MYHLGGRSARKAVMVLSAQQGCINYFVVTGNNEDDAMHAERAEKVGKNPPRRSLAAR